LKGTIDLPPTNVDLTSECFSIFGFVLYTSNVLVEAVLSTRLVTNMLRDTVVTSFEGFLFYFRICLNIQKTRQFRSQYNSCWGDL
jgi:hypothetical protein